MAGLPPRRTHGRRGGRCRIGSADRAERGRHRAPLAGVRRRSGDAALAAARRQAGEKPGRRIDGRVRRRSVCHSVRHRHAKHDRQSQPESPQGRVLVLAHRRACGRRDRRRARHLRQRGEPRRTAHHAGGPGRNRRVRRSARCADRRARRRDRRPRRLLSEACAAAGARLSRRRAGRRVGARQRGRSGGLVADGRGDSVSRTGRRRRACGARRRAGRRSDRRAVAVTAPARHLALVDERVSRPRRVAARHQPPARCALRAVGLVPLGRRQSATVDRARRREHPTHPLGRDARRTDQRRAGRRRPDGAADRRRSRLGDRRPRAASRCNVAAADTRELHPADGRHRADAPRVVSRVRPRASDARAPRRPASPPTASPCLARQVACAARRAGLDARQDARNAARAGERAARARRRRVVWSRARDRRADPGVSEEGPCRGAAPLRGRARLQPERVAGLAVHVDTAFVPGRRRARRRRSAARAAPLAARPVEVLLRFAGGHCGPVVGRL